MIYIAIVECPRNGYWCDEAPFQDRKSPLPWEAERCIYRCHIKELVHRRIGGKLVSYEKK